MRRALLPLLLALAGCAATPLAPAPVDATLWPAQRDRLQALAAWSLSGRVAVSARGEGWSASLAWQQQGGLSTIDVRGPLGAGAARLTVEADRATFDDGRGPVLLTAELETELAQRLGVGLPVRALRYWVLGVPDPARPAAEIAGPDGRLAALTQDGWRVDFAGYVATPAGALPGRITATRAGARLRLVVEDWQSSMAGEAP